MKTSTLSLQMRTPNSLHNC